MFYTIYLLLVYNSLHLYKEIYLVLQYFCGSELYIKRNSEKNEKVVFEIFENIDYADAAL